MSPKTSRAEAIDLLNELVRIGNVRYNADYSYLILIPNAPLATDEQKLKAAGMKLDKALTTLGIERGFTSHWRNETCGGGFAGVEFNLCGEHLQKAVDLVPELRPPDKEQGTGVWTMWPTDPELRREKERIFGPVEPEASAPADNQAQDQSERVG